MSIITIACTGNTGNVVGPASALDSRVAAFDGITGQLLKDGGQTIAQIIAAGGAAASLTVGTTTLASGATTKVLYDNAGVLGEYAVTGSGNVAMSASPTFSGTVALAALTATGTIVQTSASATAFESGPNGSTNPVFRLVNSVSSAATGLSITGNAAGSGVTLTALSSGSNENINLTPKGTGAVIIGGTNLRITAGSSGNLAFQDGRITMSSDGANIGLPGSVNIGGTGGGTPSVVAAGAFGVKLASNRQFLFSPNTTIGGESMDTGLARNLAGVVEINNGTAGTFRDLKLRTALSAAVTPAQITADQNDYTPGAGWFQRWSTDASRNVTGLAAGTDGQLAQIWNVGAQNIVLVNESASSTAANRWLTSTGADLTLAAGKAAMARYDATSARWRVYLGN